MDITSLIEIITVIVVIYFVIKLIVSPILKAVLGVIIFLIAIYLLQHFFGFNFTKQFGPFGSYLDINKWSINLNWILAPINYYIKQAKTFLK